MKQEPTTEGKERIIMQTKRHSFIEVCTNVSCGFVTSLLTWELIVEPFVEVKETFACNLAITCIYTVVAILRGFIVRRTFNNKETK